MYEKIPEPGQDPPDERYVEADCGHEVYAGEDYYEYSGNTACRDCVEVKRLERVAEQYG